MSQAFTRQQRLLSKEDFRRVFRRSKRFRCQAFTVLMHHDDLGYARIGFAIKKKFIKRANARNRLRRLVRESFRKEAAMQACSIDMVVLVNQGADQFSNEQIFEQLQILWKNIIQSCNER